MLASWTGQIGMCLVHSFIMYCVSLLFMLPARLLAGIRHVKTGSWKTTLYKRCGTHLLNTGEALAFKRLCSIYWLGFTVVRSGRRCEMGAGHFSKSGRFERLRELALEQAFLLYCVGRTNAAKLA